ncbi:hypothetical protein EG327_001912 [Venturia inaequalis]|uniref:Zinc-binding loop region of homing endonuclease domain-containing protein n=1 Tax=Venturia inaequalis TaxID=5025 RepID=A0A8H3VLD1_VENIN|nr:hypothetical protein EG327_001912 [Venturia inaequalis]
MRISRKARGYRQHVPKNLSLRSRKALVLYDAFRRPGLLTRIRRSVNKLLESVPSASTRYGNTSTDGCIINSKARGSGRIAVYASMGNGNSWGMNFGIARLLELGKLSNEEKRGIIDEGWELSHLCGNWRCMNQDHFAVEPKTINLQRMHTEYPLQLEQQLLNEIYYQVTQVIDSEYMDEFLLMDEKYGRGLIEWSMATQWTGMIKLAMHR